MKIRSMPCRFEHFSTDWYRNWAGKLGYPVADRPSHAIRKWWEYAAIAHALDERGQLKPKKRGIGFAVGREPLASLFAARGVSVLATDLHAGLGDAQWAESGQHAAALNDIWAGDTICPRRDFDRLVKFQPMDMNDLPEGDQSFDFAWSSCAFEHLGSLAHGTAFVKNAMRFLRPGGVAVHTTEFNVGSNSDTVTTGGAVIYRRCDLEELERSLRVMRYGMEHPEFDCGTHEYDLVYDEPPFFTSGKPHVKLLQDGHICTSFVIIVHAA
ncbi:MAG TPA: methyltransferase domain-containing protein [Sphingomicrobium sp.]|nr:methyltransferase domain-containing protein [Sphingomicrobium sp.]